MTHLAYYYNSFFCVCAGTWMEATIDPFPLSGAAWPAAQQKHIAELINSRVQQ